jgi:peptide/nickel transport system substrate-binding protein
MTAKDPVLRELFHDNRFKEALSISIDREEINNVFFMGLGIPRAAVTVSENDPAWEDDVGNMFNEYDPMRANRLLDQVGLTEKNSEGYRLDKTGKPLTLVLEYATKWPMHGDVSQMIKDYWKEIGIKAVVKPLETTQWYNKSKANEFGMVVLTAPNTAFGNNWWLFPQWAHNSPLYGRYYQSGGKEGEKPTPEVLEAQNLWDQVKMTMDRTEQTELVKRILRLSVENFWAIGTVAGIPMVGVVSDEMGNVPEKAAYVKTFNSPGNTHPEQYFIKQ